jgi:soluble lytic murein transglycosylase-like protein
MTKTLWITLFILMAAIPCLAQNPYQFDNFDTQNGVRVRVAPEPTRPRTLKGRLLAKLTAAQKNIKVRLTSLAYPQPSFIPASGNSTVLDGFTTGDAQVDGFIVDSGKRNGVDPVLLYAIMHQESTFKPRATSPKGARGLMQLMPPTARRFGVTNIYDPRQNIEGGARYMSFLLNYFGDVKLALAGYNAGEGAVEKYGRQVPPYQETQEYVRRIYRRYSLMCDPEALNAVRKLTPTQVASVESKGPVALNMYERSVFAVRLPDGKLQLVSQ